MIVLFKSATTNSGKVSLITKMAGEEYLPPPEKVGSLFDMFGFVLVLLTLFYHCYLQKFFAQNDFEDCCEKERYTLKAGNEGLGYYFVDPKMDEFSRVVNVGKTQQQLILIVPGYYTIIVMFLFFFFSCLVSSSSIFFQLEKCSSLIQPRNDTMDVVGCLLCLMQLLGIMM